MKIIFFGLGSIGNRHANIMSENYDHQLFAFRTGEGSGCNDLGIKEVRTWDEVKHIAPDVAFITNPTFLHIDTALKCAEMGMKLFIEKPIDCSVRNLESLKKEVSGKKIATYVAYVLRFHPVIVFLKEHLKGKKVYHVSIYNSSYLPSWHPGQNHLESYSAQAKKGGGVILDLSHEFDYIEHLFGKITDIKGAFDRVSDLTYDSEDFMDAVICTEDCFINLHQNFLSLNKERIIKIDCKDEYIYADLVNAEIEIKGAGKDVVKKFKYNMDEMFKEQMDYFFENIENDKMMNNLCEASDLFGKILKYRGEK